MTRGFGLTDTGCARANNEDFFLADNDAGLYLLADGMGGVRGGEVASRVAVETLHRFLLRAGDAEGVMPEGFSAAHAAVRKAAADYPDLDGMGTTLVGARMLRGGELEIGHVGDSRAYLRCQESVACLTHDHTWVAEMGRKLRLGEEALRKHPMRHVLTMAVGTSSELDVECLRVPVTAGDELLLSSDGLHGVVSEEILREVLFSEKNLEEKCHYLIEAARKEGGPDNITAVLIRVS